MTPTPHAETAAARSASDDALSRHDLEAVLAVTRALAAPFDLRTMLGAVTDAACRVLRAERASVWLLDAGRDELVLEVASDLPPLRLPLGTGLVGSCARDGATINVPDCYADPRFDPEVDRRSGFRTRCSVTLPLVDHRSALIGVMQVLNRQGGPFDARDVSLAQALAAQCAVALSRVRLAQAQREAERLQQELELARVVQLGTLPAAAPVLPGYAMHGLFLPAEQTGGDAYDIALVPQGLLLVLADAAGHGIAPALLVTQMHAMLRMAIRLGADLETAFRQVNDQLAERCTDGRFVNAFVGLLDPATHRLRFISGGQGPILHWCAASGQFTRHRATSFPMGAMPIERLRPPVEIELAPGDLLALVTDGVFEFEDAAGVPFGVAAVEDFLARHPGQPPAVLTHGLLAAAHAHAGGAAQTDDITMVMLRRDRARAATSDQRAGQCRGRGGLS